MYHMQCSGLEVQMKLKMLSPDCGGGECPTLYQSEDGRYFVQGYKVVDSMMTENNIPKNETLIEINAELIDFIKRS